jgi:hypothetical protein
MAEITQYNFSFADVAESLIKRQNLHEGEWVVGVEFVLNVGAMGMNPVSVRPGVMILANQFQLSKAIPGQHPPGLVVDAAVVNPAKPPKQSKPSKPSKPVAR